MGNNPVNGTAERVVQYSMVNVVRSVKFLNMKAQNFMLDGMFWDCFLFRGG